MKTIIKMDDGRTQYDVSGDIALDLIKSKEPYAKVDESELGEIYINKYHILSIQQKREYTDDGRVMTIDQALGEQKESKK
ncbi:hypothetical protein H3U50_08335 [Lactobacillus sp. M0398]|uniref:hypothetical protein n=1 Tax=unclassified Lactobacillus TaxID=2620435 RepID=UPI0018DBB86B|nr:MULTISPECIES: hypothetical protein [unclassified Lactobacillus]MBI0121804.1 hypothetical protein [Lactobacillus sp. M0398]MBI0122101.1 hypothetical protein [Lactobacillus sp. W8174]MBI0134835.1 hypothetical protein [Lactobacillus sp. W8173]